jgi:hypothetical protein
MCYTHQDSLADAGAIPAASTSYFINHCIANSYVAPRRGYCGTRTGRSSSARTTQAVLLRYLASHVAAVSAVVLILMLGCTNHPSSAREQAIRRHNVTDQ